MKEKTVIKSSRSGMTVILDADCPFEELLADLAQKFRASTRFWGRVRIALTLTGRVLAPREEFAIVNTIMENSEVEVICLIDDDPLAEARRSEALTMKLMELAACTGQFRYGDVRRGEQLEVQTSLVIIGDVRHGARVSAAGSIVVMGELRGSVHAGTSGSRNCVIAAMELAPLQLSVADISKHYGDKGRKIGHVPMAALIEGGELVTRPLKKSVLNLLPFS